MSQLDASADTPEARARAAREALVGTSIAGRYTLRALVGHGGMGAVYEAEHIGLGKRVAVKLVDPEFATDERVVVRFAREARAMSAIESPHIVTILDAGTESGRPYLVMELLRGEDLGQRLRRTRKMPVAEALHVVAQVLKGLAKAHAAGIVHRDLKPDNVFLTTREADVLFAKIVDFGVSKIERPRDKTSPLALTGRGTVLGTPFYMSPEQAQAMPDVDARADLYSVGAILFECLTGRPPHTGETYEQVILSICMRDAPDLRTIDPTIPPEVAAFVKRALSRDRSLRCSSANRMLEALHEIAPEEKQLVPIDPTADDTARMDAQGPASASVLASASASAPLAGAATQLIGSMSTPVTTKPATEKPVTSTPPTLLSAGAPPAAPTTSNGSAVVIASSPRPDAKPRAASKSPSTSIAGLPSSGRTRSMTKIVVTAVGALITGVVVMFGVLSVIEKKADVTAGTGTGTGTGIAPATLSAALSAEPSPPTITSGETATPVPTATATATAAASEATSAQPTPKHAPPVKTGSAKTPSSKKLDISRELP